MTPGLVWLTNAWLLMIVWLPVATAMLGSDMPVDRPQILMYIGPMFVAAPAGSDQLPCHSPETGPVVAGSGGPSTSQEALGIATSLLYGLALVGALALPARNYLFMFVLVLIPLAMRLVKPHLERRHP